MRRLLLVMALLFIVPSLASAAGIGGHAGMRAGVGLRGAAHPGLIHGFGVPNNRAIPFVGGGLIGRGSVVSPASPPLIIERHGDRYESTEQANRPAAGPLVIEWRGDKFERIR